MGVRELGVAINGTTVWQGQVRQAPGVRNKDFAETIRIAELPVASTPLPSSTLRVSGFEPPKRATSYLSLATADAELSSAARAASQLDLLSVAEPEHRRRSGSATLSATRNEVSKRSVEWLGQETKVEAASTPGARPSSTASWLADDGLRASPQLGKRGTSPALWLQDQPKPPSATTKPAVDWLASGDVPAPHAEPAVAVPQSAFGPGKRAFSAQTGVLRPAHAVPGGAVMDASLAIPQSRRNNERQLEDLVMEQYRQLLSAQVPPCTVLDVIEVAQERPAAVAATPKRALAKQITIEEMTEQTDSPFDPVRSFKAEQKLPAPVEVAPPALASPEPAPAEALPNRSAEAPHDPLMSSFITPVLPSGACICIPRACV